MRAFATGLAFFARRAGQAILVMLAIPMIAFAVQGALGDPLREIMGEAVPEAERAELRHKLGLDAPWPVQLARYLGNAAQGDLGTVLHLQAADASRSCSPNFPASFELVLGASLIVLFISLPAGIYCAVQPALAWRKTRFSGLSVLGISVPVFLTGIFSSRLLGVARLASCLRARRDGAPRVLGDRSADTLDGLKHLLLPALTLSSIMLPLFIRLVRGAMLDRTRPDYVRTARAKGASPLRVWLHHALRNALLPLVALGGLQIGNCSPTRSDRDGVPMARHGLSLSRGGDPRRRAADHHLSRLRRPPVRRHQHARRYREPLLDPAHQPRGHGDERAAARARASARSSSLRRRAAGRGDRRRRCLASIALAAFAAPLIAPQNPFDLASFDVLDADLPPFWLDGSDPALPARHRLARPRSLERHPLRHAHLAHRRRARGR